MSTSVHEGQAQKPAAFFSGQSINTGTRRRSSVLIGVMALWLVLAGIALANITLALLHAWISGPSLPESIASLVLVAARRRIDLEGPCKAADPVASILGYSGGALFWMGFFEWTWRYFSPSGWESAR